ncbi:hypothetical protein QVD17_04743 [Tagetes erecta]|uniref:Uncharacterized protein n=1 Tax=Tagetes erecta TaxID=13708 RepID=A0AAD8P4S9_TARER|nr:hypothetical protein QVD17_04743 [Tagetes erecta]
MWGGCSPESAPRGNTAPPPFGPEYWGAIWGVFPESFPELVSVGHVGAHLHLSFSTTTLLNWGDMGWISATLSLLCFA